jgi:hypothetical protein
MLSHAEAIAMFGQLLGVISTKRQSFQYGFANTAGDKEEARSHRGQG